MDSTSSEKSCTNVTNKDASSESDSSSLVEIKLGKLVRRSKITDQDLDHLIVKCSACGHQINQHNNEKVKRHKHLKVLVCQACEKFYNSGEFSQDEDGDKYCRWCAQGGKLYGCDYCHNMFCNKCLRRNFGRGSILNIGETKWKCYCCNPEPLGPKIAFCDLIIEFSNKVNQNAKSTTKNTHLEPSTTTTNWLNSTMEEAKILCMKFQTKLINLQNNSNFQKKSNKHMINKLEILFDAHKSELNMLRKNMHKKYIEYIETIKSDQDKSCSEIEVECSKGKENLSNGTHKLSEILTNSSINQNENDENHSEMYNIDFKNTNDENHSELCNIDFKNANDENHSELCNIDFKNENNKNDDDFMFLAETINFDLISKPLFEDDTELQNESAKNMLLQNSDSDSNLETKTNTDLENKIIQEKLKICDTNSEANTSIAKNKKEKPSFAESNTSKTDLNPSKKSVEEEFALIFSNSSENVSDSSSSLSDILISNNPKSTKTNKQSKQNVEKNIVSSISILPNYDDPKLKMYPVVLIEKLDFGDSLSYISENRLILDIDTKFSELEKLKKSIDNLIKIPKLNSKNVPKKYNKNKISKKKEIKRDKEGNSSDDNEPIILSSGNEEEEILIKEPIPDELDENELAKKNILNSKLTSDSSSDSGSVIEEKKKTAKTSKNVQENDSSDDFQPRKKTKYDKLLNMNINLPTDSKGDNEEKKNKIKKQRKRQLVFSDESEAEAKKDFSDSSSEDVSEDEKNTQKKKKRRRIKRVADSSGNSDNKDSDIEILSSKGKGRKNIRKVISKDKVSESTKEAQQAEKERRRRIQERQNLYNKITDKSFDGKEEVTMKMVLEVDPVSKEEIVEIDPDLVCKLKPHQVNGVKFMWECTIESLKDLETKPGSGCILAHCMGLGKTLQVIAFLHICLTNKHVNKTIKTALVICPYNTVLNWANEFSTWLENVEESFTVHEIALAKDNETRFDILKHWKNEGGVLIIGYDIFRRLVEGRIPRINKKKKEKIFELLANPGADIVVCDEGHILKNETSAISKATSQIATKRRIVLTGTPLQNNLKEYHCMVQFVKPNLLGSLKEFRNRFVNPITNGQYYNSSERDVKLMKKRSHILHKLLEGCIQRCDYSALTKFLPPKHEFVISVKLSDVQIKMYRYYLDNFSAVALEDKLKIDGSLFTDYCSLKNIWTYPYLCHMKFVKTEAKRILESEDDFINDQTSESSESNAESDKNASSSNKKKEESSEEEVIKTYKTRSRKNDSEKSGDELTDKNKEQEGGEWYHEFIKDDDKFNIETSGKLILLFDILKKCEEIGDKVIVFSGSLLTLDIIEDLLEYISQSSEPKVSDDHDIYGTWIPEVDYFRMDGATSATLRKRWIDWFNDPLNLRARLFLISTRAGSLGTNLVGANRVVILDTSWNPSIDVQAIFRVYRFGQTKPVYVYRLIAKGTMEEKVYDRQVTKLSLSIRVVDEQQIDRHFDAAQLRELYNFTPDSTTDRPTPLLPKDRLLADLLIKRRDWIITYHEHDSLLQNRPEEDLTEEERQAAWTEYEHEKEGLSTLNSSLYNEADLASIYHEPDFTQAEYDGPRIPDPEGIIKKIAESIKTKFQHSDASFKRYQLLEALNSLIKCYQEKHVKILRQKQEYLARGSVPRSINTYLEEIEHSLNKISNYRNELKKAMPIYNMQTPQQREFATRMQANLSHFAQLRAQQQAFQQHFNGQYNMQNNFRGNFNTYNLPRNFNLRFPYYNQQQPTKTVLGKPQDFLRRPTYNASSGPIITEVQENEPDSQNLNNVKSSVQITEID